jgi:hypothetical protein
MDKPNYLQLAELIKNETDPAKKQELIQQLYVFVETLTDEEKDLFNYINKGYIKDNPGPNTFVDNTVYPFDNAQKAESYVGVYYAE